MGRPLAHLPIIAAACAATYAGSLALVAGQQSVHDARLAAARDPMLEAARRAAFERARTMALVNAASEALAAAADGYAGAINASATLDAALAALAEQVSAVTGSAAQLPDSIALPAAPSRVVQQVVVAPPTQATTGASGG